MYLDGRTMLGQASKMLVGAWRQVTVQRQPALAIVPGSGLFLQGDPLASGPGIGHHVLGGRAGTKLLSQRLGK